MSLQYPIIPIATNPVGIDAVVIDLQGLLNSNLSWLSDGLGRAYKMNKVRSNGAAQILPLVYLGTSNYTYFSAQPDNDKQGQNFILVGDGVHINQQQGFYSILEYDISIIFSVNLKLINAPLLLTEDFTQNLIAQVRDVLLRKTLGKPYNIGQITETRLFGDVYSEFDILNDSPNTGKAMTEMSYFRFNFSTQIKETCPVPVLPSISCFSMDLDGVNGYINVPNNPIFNIQRTDSVSFEFVFKLKSLGTYNLVFSKYDNSLFRGFWVGVSPSGQLTMSMQHNTGANGFVIESLGAAISKGVWYTVLITYSGNSLANGVKFYLNGVLLANDIPIDDALTLDIQNTNNLEIGAISSSGIYSDIVINLTRMWNAELNSLEVSQEYNNLLSFYSNNILLPPVRPLSTIINSQNGNGATWNGSEFDIVDGTGITAGYTTVNAEEADKIEICPITPLPLCFSMDLDGVNELIQAPINTALDLVRTDSMSFECWVKFDSLGVINRLVSKYGGLGARGILFMVEGVELRFDLQHNGGLNGLTARTTGANIITGDWYHLLVTYDGSEDTSGVNLYVNGIIQTKIALSNTLSDSILTPNNLQIGGLLPTGGGFSNGLFNYVRIWKTELTPAEILTQYNSGVPLTNAVRFSDLILECNSGNGATWNGSEFDIVDGTSITAGYTTVNAEEEDKIEDCPT